MTIDGTYDLNLSTPVGTQQGRLVLETDGTTCRGTLTNKKGETRFDDGACDGDAVSFETRIPTPLGRLRAHVSLTVDGDQLHGTAKLPLGVATIEGHRSEGGQA